MRDPTLVSLLWFVWVRTANAERGTRVGTLVAMLLGVLAIAGMSLFLIAGYRATPTTSREEVVRGQTGFQVAMVRASTCLGIGFAGFFVVAYLPEYGIDVPFAVAVIWIVVWSALWWTTALLGRPSILVLPLYRNQRLRGRRRPRR